MSPTSYQLLHPAISSRVKTYTLFSYGAEDRGRTGTIGKDRGILSPVRLPIPPLRHVRFGLEPEKYSSVA